MIMGFAEADVATVIGMTGTVAGVAWAVFRDRSTILAVQAASGILFLTHWYLKGADTAAALCAVSVTQALAAIPLGTRPSFRYVYLATIPLVAVLLALTWKGTPSIFAAIGAAGVALGRYQVDTLRFRVGLACSFPFWFTHNIMMASIPAMTADVLSLAVNLAMIRRLIVSERAAG